MNRARLPWIIKDEMISENNPSNAGENSGIVSVGCQQTQHAVGGDTLADTTTLPPDTRLFTSADQLFKFALRQSQVYPNVFDSLRAKQAVLNANLIDDPAVQLIGLFSRVEILATR